MTTKNLIKAEERTSADVLTYTNTALGQVRVIGDRDNPLFCLRDVCNVLGIAQTKDVKASIINEFGYDGDLTHPISDNMGRIQQAIFITEPQLYFVLMRSDKPKAKPFRQWVVKEVLPSIRKTGSYGLPQTYLEALECLVAKEKQAIAQAKEIEALNNRITQDAPMTELGKTVSSSEGCINIGQLAVLLQQNGVNIGRNQLFKYLRDNGYLVNQKGKERNRPTKKAMDLGLFEVQERVVTIDNKTCPVFTTMVTAKGQQYFLDIFLKAV